MKKSINLILAFVLIITLAACQSKDPAGTDTTNPPAENTTLTPATSNPPSTEVPSQTNDIPTESSYAESIEELLAILILNPDDKAVWRKPEEAIEIATMGDDALAYLFSLLELGIKGEYPRAEVIMDLCRDMLSEEDINLRTDRPKYWYEMFKGRVLRLRNLNTAADMAARYPMSSVLLSVLGIPESAPVAPPVVVEIPDLEILDATKPLADSEFVLFNGVRFGMSMAEVLAITGEDVEFYDPAFPENQTFTHDGIFYGCYRAEGEDTFVLTSVSFNDSTHPAIRGIRFGDTLESVFDKFPVRDRELKQWAWQMLYGHMPEEGQPHKNYAALEFVAGSFYSMRVLAESYMLNIAFSRVEQKVITLSLGRL